MATPIHFHDTTTATPEQYVAGLTDFGPGRAELFGNSADGDLEVHSVGATEADVTEGSGGVWERLQYDWSDPKRVVLTTTDSNLWGGDQATPTPSRATPTARPTSTTSSYARARTSRDGCSGACSGPSARAACRPRS